VSDLAARADRETCRECGHSWGVTMKPRESVLCSDCVAPRTWRRPVHYWNSRVWNFPHPSTVVRDPEWWDAQTSLQDLKFAASIADQIEPKPVGQLMLEVA
jgi:hypothetical protein